MDSSEPCDRGTTYPELSHHVVGWLLRKPGPLLLAWVVEEKENYAGGENHSPHWLRKRKPLWYRVL